MDDKSTEISGNSPEAEIVKPAPPDMVARHDARPACTRAFDSDCEISVEYVAVQEVNHIRLLGQDDTANL